MSDSEQDDDGSSEDEQEEVNENMRIFLRLRPMNKLETSRRSKNCVELDDDDPRCISVDSPLEGEYDFSFDHVRHRFIRERQFLFIYFVSQSHQESLLFTHKNLLP